MSTSGVRPLTRVEAAVHLASRRRTLVIAAEELALAAGVFWAGAILMLLLGTAVLSGYWLILFAAAGTAFAVFRARSRTLSKYRIAQSLDHRLRLHDSLSTAWFLLTERSDKQGPLSDLLVSRADELTAAIRPVDAFPFTGRRAWAITSALAAVALALFAIRYSVAHSLNLRPSLIPLPITATVERIDNLFVPRERPRQELAVLAHQGETDSQNSQRDLRNQDPGRNSAEPALSAGQSSEESKDSQSGAERSRDPKNARGEGKQNDASSQPGRDGQTGQQQISKQADSQQAAPSQKDQDANQQSSSGLMDKMKDALSSLIAKARPNGEGQKTGQNQPPANDAQKNANSSNGSGQNRQQNAGNQNTNKEDGSEGQGKGQTAEKAQAAQGRNAEQSAESGSSSQSGVGRQDGDKNVTEAQQLQALGKLQQIIGKRSADLTGEMTVEPSSGKQQLKTAYSNRLGHHSDAGGEINRDEVPLDDQQYVRAYMEQVHKHDKHGN